MIFDQVAIIGLGLIGGSVARALRNRGLAGRLVAVGRNRVPLEAARSDGAIDQVETDPVTAIRGTNLVVLATPVRTLGPLLEALWPHLDPETLLTDVGSVKTPLVRLADRLQASRPAGFVGSHPMAGSEQSGYFSSRADLFEGAVTFVTPGATTPAPALKQAHALWEGLGSRVVEVSPEDHDRIVAAVSHLPHLVAYALVAAVASVDGSPLGYAAGGFKSTTRIAGSSGSLWREIFELNRTPLLEALSRYRGELDRLDHLIRSGAWDLLEQALEEIRRTRESLR